MQRGHWNTTVANAWGTVALDRFAAKFESTVPAGTTSAALAGRTFEHAWKPDDGAKTYARRLPWPDARADVTLRHDGTGVPWVTLTSVAAIPVTAPFSSGYRISRAASRRSASRRRAPGAAATWRGSRSTSTRNRTWPGSSSTTRCRPARPRWAGAQGGIGARCAGRTARRRRVAGVRGADRHRVPRLFPLRAQDASSSNTRCAWTILAISDCRRRVSRRYTRPRCSASGPTTPGGSRRDRAVGHRAARARARRAHGVAGRSTGARPRCRHSTRSARRGALRMPTYTHRPTGCAHRRAPDRPVDAAARLGRAGPDLAGDAGRTGRRRGPPIPRARRRRLGRTRGRGVGQARAASCAGSASAAARR